MSKATYPRIKVPPPGPNSRELMKEKEKYVSNGVGIAHPIFIKRAYGGLIEDVDGNIYIDFAGGIGVINAGHTHPQVIRAVKEQLDKYLHTCFMVIPYEPYVKLAGRLSQVTAPELKKSVFLNSGAEAVENAVKISVYYQKAQGILVFDNAFHGRTRLTMTMTGKNKPYKYHLGHPVSFIERLPFPYCYRCPFGKNLDCDECSDRVMEYISYKLETHYSHDEIAALIIELVQGEGGFIVAPKKFVKSLFQLTKELGILFISDEVQTGFGRTAKMFAYEHYNITPDMITFGKSIAAGFPLSGVIGREEIMDSIHPGGLGGTFGGNPVAAIAGIEVIDIIEKNLGNAEKIGKLLLDRFNEFKEEFEMVGDARGLGAMVAMELVKDKKSKKPAPEVTKKITHDALSKGLVIIKSGIYSNVIRVLVPITVELELVEKGLDILESVLKENIR